MRKTPTYHSSRSPAQHTAGSPWSGGLIGPVRVQSRGCTVYIDYISPSTTRAHYKYFPDLRAKSNALRELEAWHATMIATGIQPHILTTDLGDEFAGQATGDLYSRLGIAHRPHAPGDHVDDTDSSHRRLNESARPALRDALAPLSL